MQFYSWQKFGPVGSPLVEPKWIQWDPDVTVAALAYPDSLVLCRLRPTFKPIASLSIQVRLLRQAPKNLLSSCSLSQMQSGLSVADACQRF